MALEYLPFPFPEILTAINDDHGRVNQPKDSKTRYWSTLHAWKVNRSKEKRHTWYGRTSYWRTYVHGDIDRRWMGSASCRRFARPCPLPAHRDPRKTACRGLVVPVGCPYDADAHVRWCLRVCTYRTTPVPPVVARLPKHEASPAIYTREHRTSTPHHRIASHRTTREGEKLGAKGREMIALWVAACSLLSWCSSLSGESSNCQFITDR